MAAHSAVMPQGASPERLTLGLLFRFYIPLSLNAFLMQFSHGVISAGLAALADGPLALAAYGVAYSTTILAENPLHVVREMTVTLAKGPNSRRTVLLVTMGCSAVVSALLFFLAYTGPGSRFYIQVLGLTEPVASHAVAALRMVLILPFLLALRSFFQGLLIQVRHTAHVPVAGGMRVVAVSAWLAVAAYIPDLPGAVAGGIAFCLALGTEAAVSFAGLWLYRRRQAGRPEPLDAPLPAWAAIKFMAPLLLMTAARSSAMPALTAGIARLESAAISLGAFAVAHTLVKLSYGPTMQLRQVPIVLGQSDTALATIRRFVGLIALVLTGVLGSIWLPPVARAVLEGLMNLPPEMAAVTRRVLQILTPLPAIYCLREYALGVLMRQRRTMALGLLQMLSFGVLLSTFAVLALTVGGNGAFLAAWALLLGETFETLLLLYWGRRPE